MSDFIISESVNFELERTPGEAAVSQQTEEDGQDVAATPAVSSPISSGAAETNSVSPEHFTRFVGFKKIKDLLQPIHKFFSDKKAWIDTFSLYSDKNVDLVYPVIKSERGNPYRKHQLTQRSSQRTYKRIRQIVEGHKNSMADFKVADLVFTMPKFMSEYLASQGKPGRDMAWRIYDRLWTEDIPEVINQPGLELASHVNLHIWRSEKPLEPHFHFHVMIPNCGMEVNDNILDEEGDPTKSLTGKWNWHRQRGGRVVPFSDSQLSKLKELWSARLQSFCKRHGLEWREQKIDIFVAFIDDWARFLHKLNYTGRSWLEDYALYSNECPDCPEPPAWLVDYGNKARVKGWWSNLKDFSVEDKEKDKVSPYTGEKMTYVGRVGLQHLTEECRFGRVEFVKGRAVELNFSGDELEWLNQKMIYNRELMTES